MKRKVKIVRRDYAAEYAKDVHDYEQLRSWFELMIERANKRADAQEADRNELLERINHLENMVEVRDKRIADLQAMLNKTHTYAGLHTVSEVKETIANFKSVVEIEDKFIAVLQKLVYKFYKKEES